MLTTALGGAWTLEQPEGSVAEMYPVFRMVLRSIFEIAGPHAVSLMWFICEIVITFYLFGCVEVNGKTLQNH